MKSQKTFDCLEYKRAIQAKHAENRAGLPSSVVAKDRRNWLDTSSEAIPRLWREMRCRHANGNRSNPA